MQIICRKKLLFQDHEIVKNEKTGENVAILKRSFLVSPSVIPQEVPDWIKVDDMFNFSVDSGTITVVQVLSTPKIQTQDGGKGIKTETTDTSKPQQETPSAGWGAKPGTGLPNGNDINAGTQKK